MPPEVNSGLVASLDLLRCANLDCNFIYSLQAIDEWIQ
jgi:hypothetical protein